MNLVIAIGKKAGRQFGGLLIVVIGVVCVAALFAKSGSTRTKTAAATSTSLSNTNQFIAEVPISIAGFARHSSSDAVIRAAPFVIHLPPRRHLIEPDGTHRQMSSAEAIAGRSFDLIDTRYQPEIDLGK